MMNLTLFFALDTISAARFMSAIDKVFARWESQRFLLSFPLIIS